MAGLEGSHENRCEIPKACLRKNTANFRTDYPKDKEALQLMVRGGTTSPQIAKTGSLAKR
jgi:hypothetical protein